MTLNHNLLSTLRQQNPLVHNITNIVVANYVANGLLALGGSPIMSSAIEEMDELAAICSAVAINIGTLTAEQVKAMLAAGKAANQHGTPVLLDPVGVGATTFRRETVQQLLAEVQFGAIRGNAGEMAALAEVDWQAKGVDAGSGSGDVREIAQLVAQRYQTVAVVSGEVDVISDGQQTVEVRGGTPLFPMITGSGCLHGAVCAAFMAMLPDNLLSACVTACAVYGAAGEIVATDTMSSGSFTTALLNGLSIVQPDDVARMADIRQVG